MSLDRLIGSAVLAGIGVALSVGGVAIYDAVSYRFRQDSARERFVDYIHSHPKVERYFELGEGIAQGYENDEEVAEFVSLRHEREVTKAKELKEDIRKISQKPSWRGYIFGATLGLLAGAGLFEWILRREKRSASVKL